VHLEGGGVEKECMITGMPSRRISLSQPPHLESGKWCICSHGNCQESIVLVSFVERVAWRLLVFNVELCRRMLMLSFLLRCRSSGRGVLSVVGGHAITGYGT